MLDINKLPNSLKKDIITKLLLGQDASVIDLAMVRHNYNSLKEAFNTGFAHFFSLHPTLLRYTTSPKARAASSLPIPVYKEPPRIHIYAAAKANTAPGVLETINTQGSNFEVATIGELQECISRGIPSKKIIFTHPAKDMKEILDAYKKGVRTFVTDCKEDIATLAACLKDPEDPIKVLVRVKTLNSDNEQGVLAFNGRFGVPITSLSQEYDDAESLILEVNDTPGLVPLGLAFHVGTQQENIHAWDETIQACGAFYDNMLKKHQITLPILDIGGGFPSRYRDDIPTYGEYGITIVHALQEAFKSADSLPEIWIEPGRALSATAGITVGRIMQTKEVPPDKTTPLHLVTLSTGRFSAGLWGVGNGYHCYTPYREPSNNTYSFKPLESTESIACILYGKACAGFDTPMDNTIVFFPKTIKQNPTAIVVTGTGAYSSRMTTQWCSKEPPNLTVFDSEAPIEIPLARL